MIKEYTKIIKSYANYKQFNKETRIIYILFKFIDEPDGNLYYINEKETIEMFKLEDIPRDNNFIFQQKYLSKLLLKCQNKIIGINIQYFIIYPQNSIIIKILEQTNQEDYFNDIYEKHLDKDDLLINWDQLLLYSSSKNPEHLNLTNINNEKINDIKEKKKLLQQINNVNLNKIKRNEVLYFQCFFDDIDGNLYNVSTPNNQYSLFLLKNYLIIFNKYPYLNIKENFKLLQDCFYIFKNNIIDNINIVDGYRLVEFYFIHKQDFDNDSMKEFIVYNNLVLIDFQSFLYIVGYKEPQ
jgi:hypothetical protein